MLPCLSVVTWPSKEAEVPAITANCPHCPRGISGVLVASVLGLRPVTSVLAKAAAMVAMMANATEKDLAMVNVYLKMIDCVFERKTSRFNIIQNEASFKTETVVKLLPNTTRNGRLSSIVDVPAFISLSNSFVVHPFRHHFVVFAFFILRFSFSINPTFPVWAE